LTRINLESSNVSKEQIEERAKNRSRKIYGEFFKTDYSKVPFIVRKADYDEYGSIFSYMTEEDIRKQFLYPHINEKSMFFDIGASIGSWSLPALAQGATVVAFEPDPRAREVLFDNAKLNRFEKLITFERAVLDKSYGNISFDELEDVPTMSIDEEVIKEPPYINNRIPTIMKIDAEGAEARIIEGATNTIRRYKPKIMVENHLIENTEEWIKTKLKMYDYKCEEGLRTENVAYSFFTID